jgi:hypothetical protein
MNDFFGRAGPRRGGRDERHSFRDSLAELRDRLRDGLADAASRAVASAVRRAAGSLLGGEDDEPPRLPQPREYGRGWDDEYGYDPGGWRDDPWRDERLGWGGRDEQREGIGDEPDESGPGPMRRAAAACCQALAWLTGTLWPRQPLGSLASAVLAALALILGGGRFACEAGLALAEAAWAIVEMLTAEPEPSGR